MTHDEAKALKSFKHYCNCGGFAASMNGRNPDHPHLSWCPQLEEYEVWWAAMNKEE